MRSRKPRNLFLTFLLAAILLSAPLGVLGITCYECQSSQGQDCRFQGTTCAYGMFGCIKIAAFSGGVDKLGNWYDQNRDIIYSMRGCNVLPIGGVDACQQQSLIGVRLVTCYCFTDYCNSAPTVSWAQRILSFALPLLGALFACR